MRKFQFFRVLWQLGPDAMRLFDFPGLEDSVELRAWCKESLNLLDDLADLTTTEADDAVVDALRAVVDNDTAFNGLHALLSMLIDLDGDDDKKVGATDPNVVAIAEAVGIDPFTIFSAVMMALKAIRMFREWRQNR